MKEIEKYISININNTLINSKSLFYKREHPLISIVISIYNGEAYINTIVRSIQNQNFLNIEIIIVDDCSKDNSIKMAQNLMKDDTRIILLKNKENKGALYSKTIGILNSNGKYVMTLDQDNLYGCKDAFSFLIREAEKNDLDILGFSAISTTINLKIIKKEKYLNYIETPIIYKPFIKGRILGKKFQSSTLLFVYFIRNKLFKTIINLLGYRILNRNIDIHDDTILTFLLSRKANNLKHTKKIIYIVLSWPNSKSPQISFQEKIKTKNREIKKCLAYLTLIEVLLLFTEDNIEDKEIASNFLMAWFLNNECRKNRQIITLAISICKLFLNNKYINLNIKYQINIYLKEINNMNYIL